MVRQQQEMMTMMEEMKRTIQRLEGKMENKDNENGSSNRSMTRTRISGGDEEDSKSEEMSFGERTPGEDWS